MFGNCSHASKYIFKIDEVNIAPVWNPSANNSVEFGGFNFTNEENVLRWLIRGDTLYDVIIPEDAEVVRVENKNTPNAVWRTNKIIVTNPRKVTDDMCLELFKISNMPLKTYYQVLAILAGKGFYNTCLEIIHTKINNDNIDECINEFLEFGFYKKQGVYETILQKLYTFKNS
jgi:hypothetical protein